VANVAVKRPKGDTMETKFTILIRQVNGAWDITVSHDEKHRMEKVTSLHLDNGLQEAINIIEILTLDNRSK
jgi:hypothetical protein